MSATFYSNFCTHRGVFLSLFQYTQLIPDKSLFYTILHCSYNCQELFFTTTGIIYSSGAHTAGKFGFITRLSFHDYSDHSRYGSRYV